MFHGICSVKPGTGLITKVVMYVVLCFVAYGLCAEELYFVDAHSQYERDITGQEIIKYMDDAGVKAAIISTRRGRKAWDAVSLAADYPGRVFPAVRVKGKDYTNNTKRFYKNLIKQIESDSFSAMGEVHMFHAQKGEWADDVEIHVYDKRIETTLKAAIDHGWPFVVHIEFASLSRGRAESYMSELEKLLNDHPEHPIALIHMGQLDSVQAGKLLARFKNIYFLTSHADTITVSNSNQPWIDMFEDGELKSQWKSLVLEYPDHFVFAVDAVWADQWRNDYVNHVKLWRKALSALPGDIAEKVAHGNAEKLWKLRW